MTDILDETNEHMVACDAPNRWILLLAGNAHHGWVFGRKEDGAPLYSLRMATKAELIQARLRAKPPTRGFA